MTEIVKIWLPDAKSTVSAGASLARTLYNVPLTVRLFGSIGAGKTTFVKGFADGLGVRASLQSPTFALEQRYTTLHYGELLHGDLHRLSKGDAQSFLEHTASHAGIRCIEWPERAEGGQPAGPLIDIFFDDADPCCRRLAVHFQDLSVPDWFHVQKWRKNMHLPRHICRHSDAVGAYAEFLARRILRRGILVRPLLLRLAGELHDLLRFLDFRVGGGPPFSQYCSVDYSVWEEQRARYPSLSHEAACAAFLEAEGYGAVGHVVRTHGSCVPLDHDATIEQKLLFYADKRWKIDRLVTLEERFRDFCVRYGVDAESAGWYSQARDFEREFFPQGVPPFSRFGRWRRFFGVVLLVLGLVAFLTPLTPGAWLIPIGMELLGIRFALFPSRRKWRLWKQ